MGKVLYPGYFPNECKEPVFNWRWLETTLSGKMRAVWRVRQWKITVRLQDNVFGDGDYEFFYRSDANTEEELVCGVGLHLINSLGWDFEEFNIYPFYFFDLSYRASDDGGDYGVVIGEGSDVPDELGRITYNVQISNFGADVALIYCCSVFDNYTPDILTTILEIQANEYWSYGGTYDTETGEPL